MRAISIAKFEEGIVNEDAAIAKENLIAVSDGAGGGGVFADRWSRYLVEHLPDEPIIDYQAFDQWIDSIWETFYNECEDIAKQEGGMFLNKFYDEGSFATLVAIWKNGQWISYGDSVAFCYDRKSGELHHSFTKLTDFNNAPFLINCKDPLSPEGFRSGTFKMEEDSVVFAVSDALAHYILMMYEVAHQNEFERELQEAISAQTKDSNFIKVAMGMKKVAFEKDITNKLLKINNKWNFEQHLHSLRKKGLIGHDDYSLAIL